MKGCPSHSDLMWFAETGELPKAGTHPVKSCSNCQTRLKEYQTICDALRELGPLVKTKVGDLAFDEQGQVILPETQADDPPTPKLPDLQRIAPEAVEALAVAREARKYFLNDWAKARQLAGDALRQCERLPDSQQPAARELTRLARAEALTVMGVCDVFNDRSEEGQINLTRALQIWDEIGEPLGIGSTRHYLAIACMNRKSLTEAEFHARQALEELLGICQDDEAAKARNTLAIILSNQGRTVEARAQYLEVLPEFKRMKRQGEWAMAAVSLAYTERLLGSLEEAIRLAEAAEPILLQKGFTYDAARCAWLLGRLQIEQYGATDKGLEKMLAARESLLKQGMWIEPAIINCDAAKALLKANRRQEAHVLLRSIQDILPVDQTNRWVIEAIAALEREFAEGSESSLLKAWEHLAGQLNRKEAGMPEAENSQVH